MEIRSDEATVLLDTLDKVAARDVKPEGVQLREAVWGWFSTVLDPAERARVLTVVDATWCNELVRLHRISREGGQTRFFFFVDEVPASKIRGRGRKRRIEPPKVRLVSWSAATAAFEARQTPIPARAVAWRRACERLEEAVQLCDSERQGDTLTLTAEVLRNTSAARALLVGASLGRFATSQPQRDKRTGLAVAPRANAAAGTAPLGPAERGAAEWFGETVCHTVGSFVAHRLELAIWHALWAWQSRRRLGISSVPSSGWEEKVVFLRRLLGSEGGGGSHRAVLPTAAGPEDWRSEAGVVHSCREATRLSQWVLEGGALGVSWPVADRSLRQVLTANPPVPFRDVHGASTSEAIPEKASADTALPRMERTKSEENQRGGKPIDVFRKTAEEEEATDRRETTKKGEYFEGVEDSSKKGEYLEPTPSKKDEYLEGVVVDSSKKDKDDGETGHLWKKDGKKKSSKREEDISGGFVVRRRRLQSVSDDSRRGEEVEDRGRRKSMGDGGGRRPLDRGETASVPGRGGAMEVRGAPPTVHEVELERALREVRGEVGLTLDGVRVGREDSQSGLRELSHLAATWDSLTGAGRARLLGVRPRTRRLGQLDVVREEEQREGAEVVVVTERKPRPTTAASAGRNGSASYVSDDDDDAVAEEVDWPACMLRWRGVDVVAALFRTPLDKVGTPADVEKRALGYNLKLIQAQSMAMTLFSTEVSGQEHPSQPRRRRSRRRNNHHHNNNNHHHNTTSSSASSKSQLPHAISSSASRHHSESAVDPIEHETSPKSESDFHHTDSVPPRHPSHRPPPPKQTTSTSDAWFPSMEHRHRPPQDSSSSIASAPPSAALWPSPKTRAPAVMHHPAPSSTSSWAQLVSRSPNTSPTPSHSSSNVSPPSAKDLNPVPLPPKVPTAQRGEQAATQKHTEMAANKDYLEEVVENKDYLEEVAPQKDYLEEVAPQKDHLEEVAPQKEYFEEVAPQKDLEVVAPKKSKSENSSKSPKDILEVESSKAASSKPSSSAFGSLPSTSEWHRLAVQVEADAGGPPSSSSAANSRRDKMTTTMTTTMDSTRSAPATDVVGTERSSKSFADLLRPTHQRERGGEEEEEEDVLEHETEDETTKQQTPTKHQTPTKQTPTKHETPTKDGNGSGEKKDDDDFFAPGSVSRSSRSKRSKASPSIESSPVLTGPLSAQVSPSRALWRWRQIASGIRGRGGPRGRGERLTSGSRKRSVGVQCTVASLPPRVLRAPSVSGFPLWFEEAVDADIRRFQLWCVQTAQRRRREQLYAAWIASEVVRSVIPAATVRLFGSFVTGLVVPSSDVDVVVTDMLDPRGFHAIAAHLRSHEAVTSLRAILTARVPVLKVVVKPSPDAQPVDLDITLLTPTHRGLATTAVTRKLLAVSAPLHPLTLVVKHILATSALGDAWTGGLSSYGVVLLLQAFLAMQPPHLRWVEQSPPPPLLATPPPPPPPPLAAQPTPFAAPPPRPPPPTAPPPNPWHRPAPQPPQTMAIPPLFSDDDFAPLPALTGREFALAAAPHIHQPLPPCLHLPLPKKRSTIPAPEKSTPSLHNDDEETPQTSASHLSNSDHPPNDSTSKQPPSPKPELVSPVKSRLPHRSHSAERQRPSHSPASARKSPSPQRGWPSTKIRIAGTTPSSTAESTIQMAPFDPTASQPAFLQPTRKLLPDPTSPSAPPAPASTAAKQDTPSLLPPPPFSSAPAPVPSQTPLPVASGAQTDLPSPILGRLLLLFFRFMSNFNAQTTAISPSRGILFPRPSDPSHPWHMDPLIMPDPSDPQSNIGRNCFRFPQLQTTFRNTLQAMVDASRGPLVGPARPETQPSDRDDIPLSENHLPPLHILHAAFQAPK